MAETNEMLEFKYKTLLKTIMEGARHRTYSSYPAVDNDDEIFMVIKILEPELFEKKCAELRASAEDEKSET